MTRRPFCPDAPVDRRAGLGHARGGGTGDVGPRIPVSTDRGNRASGSGMRCGSVRPAGRHLGIVPGCHMFERPAVTGPGIGGRDLHKAFAPLGKSNPGVLKRLSGPCRSVRIRHGSDRRNALTVPAARRKATMGRTGDQPGIPHPVRLSGAAFSGARAPGAGVAWRTPPAAARMLFRTSVRQGPA